MKQIKITLILFVMTLSIQNAVQAQSPVFLKVKSLEHQLDDVMELIDTTEIKQKLREVEQSYYNNTTDLNKLRLAIIYHETALNLSFFSKTKFKGYSKKSFDLLTELFNSDQTPVEYLPFVSSYRASALALVGAETSKLKLVGDAFNLFEVAVTNYADLSYLPEFLRGSVAENLPWFFFAKKRMAKHDFQSIINKQTKNSDYANGKIMSFTYWAWAKQHCRKKYRAKALVYLDNAIALDPDYIGGRKRAEQLKEELMN